MKRIILALATLITLLFSCSGDCLSCHPALNLESDVRHQSLATCIACHSAETLTQSDMGAACGQDCFACHDAGKIAQSGVEEHHVLQGCIACHTTLKESAPNTNWQEILGIQPMFQLPTLTP